MMDLNSIKYDYVIELTKFFLEKYRDGELKKLHHIDRNVVALAPFVQNYASYFDETLWPPDKPEWNKNLIEFRVQLSGAVSYLPFRLFVKKGFNQKPILLVPGTLNWDWSEDETTTDGSEFCTCDPRMNAPNSSSICFFCGKPLKY